MWRADKTPVLISPDGYAATRRNNMFRNSYEEMNAAMLPGNNIDCWDLRYFRVAAPKLQGVRLFVSSVSCKLKLTNVFKSLDLDFLYDEGAPGRAIAKVLRHKDNKIERLTYLLINPGCFPKAVLCGFKAILNALKHKNNKVHVLQYAPLPLTEQTTLTRTQLLRRGRSSRHEQAYVGIEAQAQQGEAAGGTAAGTHALMEALMHENNRVQELEIDFLLSNAEREIFFKAFNHVNCKIAKFTCVSLCPLDKQTNHANSCRQPLACKIWAGTVTFRNLLCLLSARQVTRIGKRAAVRRLPRELVGMMQKNTSSVAEVRELEQALATMKGEEELLFSALSSKEACVPPNEEGDAYTLLNDTETKPTPPSANITADPLLVFAQSPAVDSIAFVPSSGPYRGSHGNFALKLSYLGFSWEIKFHRQTLLELHSSLKSMQLQKAMHMGQWFTWPCSSASSRPPSKPPLVAFNSTRNFELTSTPPPSNASLQTPLLARHYSSGNNNATAAGGAGAAAAREIRRLHFPRSLLYVQSSTVDTKRITDEVLMYLTAILNSDALRNLPQVYEFFKVSTQSFDTTLGPSVLEGYARVQCHINSRTTLLTWHSCRYGCLLCNCACLPMTYTKRVKYWVVIKHHCAIFLHKPLDLIPAHVLLFDSRGFDLRKGFSTTGRKKAFFLYSNAWIADFKFPSRMEMKAWTKVLQDALQTKAPATAWQNREHPNFSFAPVRTDGCLARFLVDGQAYFTQVLAALRLAQRQIFISGWWVTPDIELERGASLEASKRITLANALIEKAKQGVTVYVLMFSELQVALTLNSKFQESRLAGVDNLYVQRHPSFNILAGKEAWYWSHHEKLVVCDGGAVAFVGGLDLCWGRYDTPAHLLVNDGVSWPGIDYYNPRVRDIEDPKAFTKSLLDCETQVRMPWHDVSCEVRGPVAKDVARHFIHQWNYAIESKTGYNSRMPVIIPQEFPQSFPSNSDGDQHFHKVKCQVLRSLPLWSGGYATDANGPEMSIQNAYLQAIASSQRYVYIENQFFVSGMSNDPLVENRIAQALYSRISKAAAEKAKFRVMVFLPLLPAFEGGDLSDASMRQVLYWQYRSICRGENRKSLWEMLEDDVNVAFPSDYLTFFSLRTYQPCRTDRTTGRAKGMVSEMIYIHSKIMIIDDHVAFIGSANINDRSMLGSRDTEVCLQLTDLEFDPVAKLNGEPWALGGKFAGSLVRELLGEHFHEPTLPSEDVLMDFLLHFDVLLGIAERNTECFEQAFHCIPSNEIKTFAQLDQRLRSGLEAPVQPAMANKFPELFTVAEANEPTIHSRDRPSQPQEEEEEEEEPVITKSVGRLSRFKSFHSFDQANTEVSRVGDIRGSAVLFPLDFLQSVKRMKPKNVVLTDIIFT
ncbi:hypothetical protein BASA81_001442 [Batrachochytrium salamandrivorans]|nr:hypothetical protein BASA81_001442 [Batrachochytrium salamandrivorans]